MNRAVLVGAGSGEGMMTLKGEALVRRADRIVYDALLDEGVLALAPPRCEKVCVGKRAGAHSMKQEEINDLLVACGKKYPLTVRLKGGDPFVFGRGGEELAALSEAGISCSVVPGVTSAVAAAELAGIPVTHRGVARAFTVVTAHTVQGVPDVGKFAGTEGTLVFLMAKAACSQIAEGLIAGGRSPRTPAALISCAGMQSMQVRRCVLAEMDRIAGDMEAPLTAVVGEVCDHMLLGRNFGNMFESCSHGARIAVVGTQAHVARVSDALLARGFSSLPCPIGRIVPLDFDGVFAALDGYEWLAFTSANGVDVFFERCRTLRIDHRCFARHRFAAVGAYTAERLARFGFHADLVPQAQTTCALAKTLKSVAPRERVAVLCAKAGNPILEQAGIRFPLYEVVYDREALSHAACAMRSAKYVTFGSFGGASALLDFAPLPEGVRAVCIGEETAKALTSHGITPSVAAVPSAEAMAEAIYQEESCKG